MSKRFGSSLDDFLAEEGILGDVEAVATKRVLVFQINQELKRQNITKSSLAAQMNTSRAAVDRLLDPDNPSVTLQTLGRVAAVLGKKLRLELS
ncbi:helix-turn-helix domain-containing protein [uncultured Meiothermus sp.]|jgi:predicted XRE-type DNA-binding protein|uniref:helix-turn-helix domain-containing protein n=1 Tax=uncultured Meiothermus sp. TaxID=157471 RepID=UPI002614E698|nr:helix-turn-helix domain-containing protein [uncultured Meiothermus sp.]